MPNERRIVIKKDADGRVKIAYVVPKKDKILDEKTHATRRGHHPPMRRRKNPYPIH